MNEQDLRAALRRAVPPAPAIGFTPPRHRPAAVPLVAAAVVLLVAVPLTVLLHRHATAQPTSRVRPGAFSCGASETAVSDKGKLPPHPIAARLCLVSLRGAHAVSRDALTTDADRLVTLLNGMPTFVRGSRIPSCGWYTGLRYRLLLQYPDGTVAVASGQLFGCGEVVVEGRRVRGAAALLHAFVSALRQQRRHSRAGAGHGELVPPPCPARSQDPHASLVAVPQDLVVARLCVRDLKRRVVREEVLSPGLLRTITRGLQPSGDRDCLRVPQFTIIGTTSRHEVVSLNSGCWALSSPWQEHWAPDAPGWAALDSLLRR